MRTLDFYKNLAVTNNHYRYMSDAVKSELEHTVPNCSTSSLDERMFWYQNGLTAYPSCKHCGSTLSSKNWYPSASKEQKAQGWAQKGYRPFCSNACAADSEQKKEASRKTSLRNFGTEHPLSSSIVQAKRKLTNMKRYGAENPHAWGSDKFRNIIEDLHGVTAVRHIPGVSNKIRDAKKIQTAMLLHDRVASIEKTCEVKLLSDISNIDILRLGDADLEWQHSCLHIYASNISFRGVRACPRCSSGSSRAERELGDWFEEHGLEVIRRDKTAIGVEVDLWIPQKNIAIEFDGTYWHSAKFVSKEKAMQKLKLASAVGIRLITLQEYLWEFNNLLVRSRLMSVMGLNQKKIGARSLEVHKITMQQANEFFAEMHLQRGARANYAFGLFDKGEIIAAASFAKPRFSTKANWELIRLASLPGITVQGGAGKLLKAFRKEHSGSILSYADRCWSTGNVYKTLGFEFLHNASPSYSWVSGKYGIYSRYQTQKKKLPKLLGDLRLDFEEALSEDENMTFAKFLKVYDRGTSAWLLH